MTAPAQPKRGYICPRCGLDVLAGRYIIVAQDNPPVNYYCCPGRCEQEQRDELAAQSAIATLMTAYDVERAAWIVEYGDERGFDGWFRNQLVGKQETK